MLVSDATGRKVVSVATAETVGKIDEFVIDPSTKSIMALMLKKTDAGGVLRWSDLTAFGSDAVTVKDDSVLSETDDKLDAMSDKHHRPMGKLMLSAAGDELGEVDDIEFDADSGAIVDFHVGGAKVAGERLIGIGTYAVVVKAE